MIRFATFALAALMAAGSVVAPGSRARAADMPGTYEGPVYAEPGMCGQPWVLRAIMLRFHHQVTHVPNLPNVAITNFYGIQQHRYLPAYYDLWPVGRSYCKATVALTDGYSRDIWYLIEEGQGYASIGNNVEFCVAGFDRWFVYNGLCRVLR
jgi:hypothetical protein